LIPGQNSDLIIKRVEKIFDIISFSPMFASHLFQELNDDFSRSIMDTDVCPTIASTTGS